MALRSYQYLQARAFPNARILVPQRNVIYAVEFVNRHYKATKIQRGTLHYRVPHLHGSVNVSILYVVMFCDIGSDEMDSTVLNSPRAGQFLKRLKELVSNSA